MNLQKFFLALALAAFLGSTVDSFATEINLNQRISTSVSTLKMGVYTKAKNAAGLEFLTKIYELSEGNSLSFRPVGALIRPLVQSESGKLVQAAGRYFGKVVIERNGVNANEWKKIQEINKREIYIYEWHIDKRPYLKALFDHPLEDKAPRFHYPESFSWDEISTQGRWTSLTASILNSEGHSLIEKAPQDIVDFCPNYFDLDSDSRTAFWIHFINAIAKRESAFDLLAGNDESNFGGGNSVVSRGALQISYESSRARPYRDAGCHALDAEDLHNFRTNITCGVAIFSHWVKTDDCISCQNQQGQWRGIARYWSTLRHKYEVPCKVCSSGKATIGHKAAIIAELKATKTCSAL